MKPNGDYLIVLANALENNLVLFQFVKGKRSPVKWIRNTPTATKQWHSLKVRITGKKVEGSWMISFFWNNELPEPVSGKIGVWSKADSVMYMDGYLVNPK